MVAKGLTNDRYADWQLQRAGLDNFTALDENGNVRTWNI